MINFNNSISLVNSNAPYNEAFITKYDINGICQWAEKISGTSHDHANSIIVGSSGNVYVGGYYTSGTMNFNNGISLTNSGSYDIFLAEYNSGGICQWAENIGGSGDDRSFSIAVDDAGNVSIAGFFNSPTINFNNGITLTISGSVSGYLAQYNSGGICQWAQKLDGTAEDYAYSIAVGSSNSLLLAGSFASSTLSFNNGISLTNTGSYDAYFANYNSSGICQWAEKISGLGEDKSYNIAVNNTGDLFISGYYKSSTLNFNSGISLSNSTISYADAFITKYIFSSVNSITTLSISPLSYCQGASVIVPFTITGAYNSSNTFTAQLSDASGSFSSPTAIGILPGKVAGKINATIPVSTPAGSGYRIRVVSCDPITTGTDNGADITVKPLPTQFTLTGGGSYCYGGTGVQVGLNGSQIGVRYQLIINGANSGPPINGTGDPISFGDQTISGTFTVVGTNTITNCSNTMSGSVRIIINPLPTQYNVTGGGAYCSGGTGVEVRLNGSQTGVSYQLIINGANVGSPVNGTGNYISFGNYTTSGTFTVIGTNTTTNCSKVMLDTVSITINPLPTKYLVTGGGINCSGGTGVIVGLSGTQKGISYQLKKNGANTGDPIDGTGKVISFRNLKSSGTFTVVATNSSTDCSQAMTDSVIITNYPSPTKYTVNGGGSYCNGGSGLPVGLSKSQSGISYQLQINGANTGSPIIGSGNSISFGNQTTAGDYGIIGIDTATICSQAMSNSVKIIVNPLPNLIMIGKLSVCKNNTEKYSSIDEAGFNRYWSVISWR